MGDESRLAEAAGSAIDTCDNLLAALGLPLDAKIHLEGVTHGLREIRRKLHAAYVETLGDDPWGDHG